MGFVCCLYIFLRIIYIAEEVHYGKSSENIIKVFIDYLKCPSIATIVMISVFTFSNSEHFPQEISTDRINVPKMKSFGRENDEKNSMLTGNKRVSQYGNMKN